ncbi:MAG: phosphodiester glycosidase family protein, partial [Candidatus Limivicinus sp.]
AGPSSEPEPEQAPVDDWKFASLTTDEPVFTDSGYSSRDICIKISSYDTGEGVIDSPYTVADIYVRDIRCLQSYFAGGKYIPTGHGEEILTLMEESGAIVAANGDYYSMQMGSGVLRNGVLYRYPKADFDVFVLYDDGSVTIYPKRSIRTEQDWAKAFENAWQVWSFGPSLLDEDGKQYEDLRASLFPVVANRNPRTGIGYYEPGHYCLVVVDGRDGDSAPGASIEEFASVFESLGCKQAYNLDGGGTSRMAFDGEIITEPSQDRVLPDIVLVAEYEGSGAWKEAQNAEEVS